MEGYEIYRLSDEEIQHSGVKGMKWGKRKSRSAYMTAVDKHEAKTKANRQKVADHKAREKEQGKAVAKAVGKKYMGAVAKHEAKSKANNEKLAAHKAREKAEGKAAVEKYMDSVDKHESKTASKREAKAVKGAARIQLAKDAIENYKKSLVKSLDDPMVKALVASSIYANNSYSMDSTRTGANAHRQMFY